ncbi:unnamed protein product [Effrenium voratum]|nr:unnamed protein product [Effrenium voratum]
MEVWFDLPAYSSEVNDTLTLENTGDEDMHWVVDVIDHNRTFEEDPFYSAKVLSPPADFDLSAPGGAVEVFDLTMFNGSDVELDDEAQLMALAFPFPHYLHYYQQAFVSCNGALIFDPVLDELTRRAATLGAALEQPGTPDAVLAAMWADLVCPKGARVSAKRAASAEIMAVRYEGLQLKGEEGNLTFEVRLHNDGRVLVIMEDFPSNVSAMSQVQVGLQPATGAKALSIGGLLPWAEGPLAVELTPWVRIKESTGVRAWLRISRLPWNSPSSGSRTSTAGFCSTRSGPSEVGTPGATCASANASSATSGFSAPGTAECILAAAPQVRRRNVTCMGNDGKVYDPSFCAGTCMDLDPVYYYDYPERYVWKDGYNNRCEDYRVLDFCRDGSYGSKWQSWWGTFSDWTSSGIGADEACCLCGGGTMEIDTPHAEEPCPTVNCPANSAGDNVLTGCRCRAGYSGEINRSQETTPTTRSPAGRCCAQPSPWASTSSAGAAVWRATWGASSPVRWSLSTPGAV